MNGPPVALHVIEFEMKAPVPPDHEAPLRARLGPPATVEDHVDTYYQHPCRDFAQTDEAVRISLRGTRTELTYKGPRLDERTKARQEIVLPCHNEAEGRAFLHALGFTPVMEIRKQRELHHYAGFEIALDTIPGLGTFLEIERQIPGKEDRTRVEQEANVVLDALGLLSRERRSYLELVDEKSGKKRL